MSRTRAKPSGARAATRAAPGDCARHAARRATLDFERRRPYVPDAGPVQLEAHGVHLYAFGLQADADALRTWSANLASDEAARAARFVHAVHRDRYIVAHGVLRDLLSRHCGQKPHEIVFGTGVHGKPHLVHPGGTRLHFNLAHADDRALIAITGGASVGVDLERERTDADLLDVARRYFHGEEWTTLCRTPAAHFAAVFCAHWVAKEAVLKGAGTGLACPLDRFGVRFAADGLTAHVTTCDPTQIAPDWLVHMLPVAAGWRAAVALRDTGSSPRFVLPAASEPCATTADGELLE
ncbi:MAG: 4'-phosphopantetheinyl transferase superfamily protein [Betaproteobacteria bacterium]